MDPKTIDNLGVETSTRYASDKERFDEDLLKDAKIIPRQTRTTATKATYPSEFETLLNWGKGGSMWGLATEPHFSPTKLRLFSEQLIPSLGPPDSLDALIEKLSDLPSPTEGTTVEKEHILKLLTQIHKSNTELLDINKFRGQYHKG